MEALPLHRYMTRRAFLQTGGAAAFSVLVKAGTAQVLAQTPFEVVVLGGQVLDGTGAPAFTADIGVSQDRIVAIGRIAKEQARHVVDANGLHVAPGFIDIHTHSDGEIKVYPMAESRVRQGITTEVTGNCGDSAAPLDGSEADRIRAEWKEKGVEASWTGMASYCEWVGRRRIAINHAQLVGAGTLRRNLVGLVNRRLTPDELKTISRTVEEAMVEGAYGLSTGPGHVLRRQSV
ncbi:MAG: amidohydrolase family protein [Gammaproteobacteria bacterium]|nr:amidohydrolase family protein [Gammaproteobacteria bacterium]